MPTITQPRTPQRPAISRAKRAVAIMTSAAVANAMLKPSSE